MAYSQDIADAICEALSEGKSLRSICAQEGMPSKWSVLKWLRENPDFATQYAYARELQGEHHADGIIEIADDQTIDPQSRRVMVDSRKWVASKLAPKKYGDKVQVGGDPDGAAIKTEDATPTEKLRLIAFALMKGRSMVAEGGNSDGDAS